ncbi:hypothetical protein [Carboxylicivirga linearis]|uniref:Uncharacterized protein n=1 Tax=Carboxylicivirga linearis TaxID=1628157 RepID=A0ABS5K2G7_9BACT|nr:hypothetical protein [Carboxylicivirga linearis]MBS2100706.1 hypothetical protein [Carboxylicivirga linearis]
MAKETKTNARKALTEKEQLELMDKFKVDTLFKNPKNEYFTSKNLANLSITAEEKKAGKKLAKITREALEGKTPEETK